jgi:dihydroflavonol-4-reductase
MPGVPQLYFGIVDVRDVADLHIRAMTHPAARGRTLPRRRWRFHVHA